MQVRICPACGGPNLRRRDAKTCSKRCKERLRITNGENLRRMHQREADKLGVSVDEYLAQRFERAVRRRRWPRCRVWFKNCEECGETFTARRSNTKLCGDGCRRKRGARLTNARIVARYRSDPDFRDSVIAAAHSRRAEKLGLGSKRITIAYLGERDGWRCGICRKPIRDRKQAGIDHIVPLARGGTHELSNVHIAHRSCNQMKHTRAMNEQLLLVG